MICLFGITMINPNKNTLVFLKSLALGRTYPYALTARSHNPNIRSASDLFYPLRLSSGGWIVSKGLTPVCSGMVLITSNCPFLHRGHNRISFPVSLSIIS